MILYTSMIILRSCRIYYKLLDNPKLNERVKMSKKQRAGNGAIAIEAQSMKKPIIASNIGGSNETIIDNKTGLLFESGNPQALSNKLKEIIKLDTLTLDLMGNEGRKNVLNRFNIEKMCFNTYSEYKKLIN